MEVDRIAAAIHSAIDLFPRRKVCFGAKALPDEIKLLLKDRAMLIRAKFREKIHPNTNFIAFFNDGLAETEAALDEEIRAHKSAELRDNLIHIQPGHRMFSQLNKNARKGPSSGPYHATFHPNPQTAHLLSLSQSPPYLVL